VISGLYPFDVSSIAVLGYVTEEEEEDEDEEGEGEREGEAEAGLTYAPQVSTT
jgi:hypothetical protein